MEDIWKSLGDYPLQVREEFASRRFRTRKGCFSLKIRYLCSKIQAVRTRK